MIWIETEQTDAPEFVEAISAYVGGALEATNPESVFIVKIDNWFGPKWLRFSHKVMGAFGVASSTLVVPPFVPNRVVSERFLSRVPDGSLKEAKATRALHREQASDMNAQRRIALLFPNTAFFWWSGASRSNGRGCLMAYLPTPEGHLPWYLELSQERSWAPVLCSGLTEAEAAALRRFAGQGAA